jgi:drug/metabolite transporter (DMT)-like permease
MSRRAVGMVLVTLSAAAYGCNPILVKIALRANTGPATLLSIRYGIAAVCLLALMALRREAFPRGRALGALVLLGALGNMGHSGLYLLALSKAPAASVAILLFVYPALVTLMAACFLKDHIPALKWIAVVVALSGAMLAVGHGPGAMTVGSLLALAAATWYAAYIVVSSRITERYTTLASTTVVVASSAAIFLIATLVTEVRPPTTTAGWAAATGTAIVGTVIAILSFFGGLSRVGPVTTSTMGTLEPIVTVVLAAAVLGEHLTPIQFLGGVMVLGAVFLLSHADGRNERLPALDT